jgi:hypothetical protein
VLINPTDPNAEAQAKELKKATRTLGQLAVSDRSRRQEILG